MGVSSPVAGKSGAVRIQRLGGVALSAAEAHGKRLDANGKGRAVYDARALSTTGLELNRLYSAHIEGAKVSKSATKALHMVLQFPTDLVDGDDAQGMLDHARSFAEEIFGSAAVFADRVDRDEKSRHVVDLFIAPKYEKETKRKTQTAISTSRDLKALAARRGRPPSLRGQGQALQDAWFEYLRDRMRLAVSRGEPKKRPGPDWKASEQLELDRLRAEQEKLAEQQEGLRVLKAELDERAARLSAKEQRLDASWDRYLIEAQVAETAIRNANEAIEKAKQATALLAEVVPEHLVKALGTMRRATISAFKELGWLTSSAPVHLTEKLPLNPAERSDFKSAIGAILGLVRLREASKAVQRAKEGDGPDYDIGSSGPGM